MTKDEDDVPMTRVEIIERVEANLKRLNEVFPQENQHPQRQGLALVTDLPLGND